MRKFFTRTAVGLAVVSLAAAVAPATPSSAAGAFPTKGLMAEQWSPSYMGGKAPSTADVETIARRFNVLAVQGGTFTKAQVDRMRGANPDLKLLVYLNGSFTQQSQGPGTKTGYAESMYAVDANGNHPYSRNFHSWLMKMWEQPWMTNRAQQCASVVASNYGANGCFVDMLGVAPIHGTYMSTIPVNNAGAKWTDPTWMDATSALVNHIAAQNPGLLIVGNGLASGRYYYGMGTDKLVNTSAQGAMAELWGRGATDRVDMYKSEATWKQDVDMLADVARKGKSLFATVKLWVSATPPQIRNWHEYTLASFLLGTDGNQYYNFSAAKTFDGLTNTQPAYHTVDVGTAVAGYAKAGCYQRAFTKGFVAVNPTNAACTVALPTGAFTDLEGNGVSGGPVTLAPHTGEVLTLNP